MGGKTVSVLFYLGSDAECSYDLLIGRDVREDFHHITNEHKKTVTWRINDAKISSPILSYQNVRSFVDTPTLPSGTLRTADDIYIPAKSTV